MLWEEPPPQLTTVLAGDDVAVHLAPVQPVASPPQTLCARTVDRRTSAESFHRLGCVGCAGEALGHGVRFIADQSHATVNLPRFLAAQARRSGTVPEQPGPSTPRAESPTDGRFTAGQPFPGSDRG